MGLSHDVKLPRYADPEFPNRCVVSGEPDPTGHVVVKVAALEWGSLFGVLLLPFLGRSRTVVVEAPANPVHARAFQRKRRVRTLVSYAVFAGLAVAAAIVLRPMGWPRIGMLLAIVAVMLPYWVVELLFPPAFDVTATRKSITYEFKDRAYAEEFARRNGAEVT